jgi:acyl-CoA synthetase (AMP-forming)/AMP-acid ligase II
MRIVLWRGYHGPSHSRDLRQLVSEALEGQLLLIPCPQELHDFSFLDSLPEGKIDCVGDWSGISIPERKAAVPVYPAQPCLGVFTSATTGRARLVLYTRKNVESCGLAIFGLFDCARIQEIFCYPQPFHTFGLTLGYAAACLLGIRLFVPEGRYSRAHHEAWLESAGSGTLTLGTPTHFLDLASHLRGNIPRASYAAIVGGARVTRPLWLAMRDVLKIEAPSIGYGATEASPGVAHLSPGVEPSEDGEVGRVLPHLKVSIDPAVGITFSGSSLCTAIIQEGSVIFPKSFTLPDLLRTREDGTLVFEGRSNFVLNRGGRKLLLEVVEKELNSRFGVEALCVSVPDLRLGEELGLLLKVPQEELHIRKDEIFAHLRNIYGMNFSANYARAVPGFPLNANLKPDRSAVSRSFRSL